jgi:prepilin peptidase CpaA
MTQWLILLIFPAAMMLAASLDLFTMTIPNWLTAGLAAAFFAVAPFAGLGLADIALHASAGLAMLVVGFSLFALGWIGGGDAKFFAATSLWLGWAHLLHYAILFSLVGGALTLVLLMARRAPLPAFLGRQPWAARLHDARSGIPYGIALAIGGLLVLPATGWMATAP